jgi:hypothetical protein
MWLREKRLHPTFLLFRISTHDDLCCHSVVDSGDYRISRIKILLARLRQVSFSRATILCLGARDGEKIYSDPIQNKLFAIVVPWLGMKK